MEYFIIKNYYNHWQVGYWLYHFYQIESILWCCRVVLARIISIVSSMVTVLCQLPCWSEPGICVASLQKSLHVGRNENGVIPNLSKSILNLNLSIFWLLFSVCLWWYYVTKTLIFFVQHLWCFSTINLLKLVYDWLINDVWCYWLGNLLR